MDTDTDNGLEFELEHEQLIAYTEILLLIAGMKTDYDKLYETNNQSAVKRLKQTIRKVINLLKDERTRLLELPTD